MVYLLYGKWLYLINLEVDTIKKENEYDGVNVSTYDLNNIGIKEVINDAYSYSLFDSKKIIICNNSYLFTSKKSNADEIKLLEKYINNMNENTILVFTLNEEKIDERKKVIKDIKRVGKVNEYNDTYNIVNIVKTMLRGYKINEDDIGLLVNRLDNNLDVIKNECDILKLYKIDDKIITTDDIYDITFKIENTNIFKLMDNIIYKHKKEALLSYHEIINTDADNMDSQMILVSLANQFRIMYQAKYLTKRGYSEGAIAKLLNVHPYMIKKALEKVERYDTDNLLIFLKKLGEIDYKSKSGLINLEDGLEMFILEL